MRDLSFRCLYQKHNEALHVLCSLTSLHILTLIHQGSILPSFVITIEFILIKRKKHKSVPIEL